MSRRHDPSTLSRRDQALMKQVRDEFALSLQEDGAAFSGYGFLLSQEEGALVMSALRGVVDSFLEVIPAELKGIRGQSHLLERPVQIPHKDELLKSPGLIRETAEALLQNVRWDDLNQETAQSVCHSLARLENIEKFARDVFLGSEENGEHAAFRTKIAALDQMATQFALYGSELKEAFGTINIIQSEEVHAPTARERTREVEPVTLSPVASTYGYASGNRSSARGNSEGAPAAQKSAWDVAAEEKAKEAENKQQQEAKTRRRKNRSQKSPDTQSEEGAIPSVLIQEPRTGENPQSASAVTRASNNGSIFSVSAALEAAASGLQHTEYGSRSAENNPLEPAESPAGSVMSNSLVRADQQTGLATTGFNANGQPSSRVGMFFRGLLNPIIGSKEQFENDKLPFLGKFIVFVSKANEDRPTLMGKILKEVYLKSSSSALVRVDGSHQDRKERLDQARYAIGRSVSIAKQKGKEGILWSVRVTDKAVDFVVVRPIGAAGQLIRRFGQSTEDAFTRQKTAVRVWRSKHPEAEKKVKIGALVTTGTAGVTALAVYAGPWLTATVAASPLVFAAVGTAAAGVMGSIVGWRKSEGLRQRFWEAREKRAEEKRAALEAKAKELGMDSTQIERAKNRTLTSYVKEQLASVDPRRQRRREIAGKIADIALYVPRRGWDLVATGTGRAWEVTKKAGGVAGSAVVAVAEVGGEGCKIVWKGVVGVTKGTARVTGKAMNVLRLPFAAHALAKIGARVGRDREQPDVELLSAGGETPGIATLRALSSKNQIEVQLPGSAPIAEALSEHVADQLAEMHDWVRSPHIVDLYVLTGTTGKMTRLDTYLERLDDPRAREVEQGLFLEKALPNGFTRDENHQNDNNTFLYEVRSMQCPRNSVGIPLAPGTEICEVECRDIAGGIVAADSLISISECHLGSATVAVPAGTSHLSYRVGKKRESVHIGHTMGLLAQLLPNIGEVNNPALDRISKVTRALRTDYVTKNKLITLAQRQIPASVNFEKFLGVLYKADPARFMELFTKLKSGMPHHWALHDAIVARNAGLPALIGVAARTWFGYTDTKKHTVGISYELDQPSYQVIVGAENNVAWYGSSLDSAYRNNIWFSNNHAWERSPKKVEAKFHFSNQIDFEQRQEILDAIQYEKQQREAEERRRLRVANRNTSSSYNWNANSSSSMWQSDDYYWGGKYISKPKLPVLEMLNNIVQDETAETGTAQATPRSRWRDLFSGIRERRFNEGRSLIGTEVQRTLQIAVGQMKSDDHQIAREAAAVLSYCLDLEAAAQAPSSSPDALRGISLFLQNPQIPAISEAAAKILPENLLGLVQEPYRTAYPQSIIAKKIGSMLAFKYVNRSEFPLLVALERLAEPRNNDAHELDTYRWLCKEISLKITQRVSLFQAGEVTHDAHDARVLEHFTALRTSSHRNLSWSIQNQAEIFGQASSSDLTTTNAHMVLAGFVSKVLEHIHSDIHGVDLLLKDAFVQNQNGRDDVLKGIGQYIDKLSSLFSSKHEWEKLGSKVVAESVKVFVTLIDELDSTSDATIIKVRNDCIEAFTRMASNAPDEWSKGMVWYASEDEESCRKLCKVLKNHSLNRLRTRLFTDNSHIRASNMIAGAFKEVLSYRLTVKNVELALRFFDEIEAMPAAGLSFQEPAVLALGSMLGRIIHTHSRHYVRIPASEYPASSILVHMNCLSEKSNQFMQIAELLVDREIVDRNIVEKSLPDIAELDVARALYNGITLEKSAAGITGKITIADNQSRELPIDEDIGVQRALFGDQGVLSGLLSLKEFTLTGSTTNTEWTTLADAFPSSDELFKRPVTRIRQDAKMLIVKEALEQIPADRRLRLLLASFAQLRYIGEGEAIKQLPHKVEALRKEGKLSEQSLNEVIGDLQLLSSSHPLLQDATVQERLLVMHAVCFLNENPPDQETIDSLSLPEWFLQSLVMVEEQKNPVSSLWKDIFSSAPMTSPVNFSQIQSEVARSLRSLSVGKAGVAQYLESRSFASTLVGSTFGDLHSVRPWMSGDKERQVNRKMSERMSAQSGEDVRYVNLYEDAETRPLKILIDLDSLLTAPQAPLQDLFTLLSLATIEKLPANIIVMCRGWSVELTDVTARSQSGTPVFKTEAFLQHIEELISKGQAFAAVESRMAGSSPAAGYDIFRDERPRVSPHDSVVAFLHPLNIGQSARYLAELKKRGQSITLIDTRNYQSKPPTDGVVA